MSCSSRQSQRLVVRERISWPTRPVLDAASSSSAPGFDREFGSHMVCQLHGCTQAARSGFRVVERAMIDVMLCGFHRRTLLLKLARYRCGRLFGGEPAAHDPGLGRGGVTRGRGLP